MRDLVESEQTFLEILRLVNKDLADFCERFSMEDEEVEAIWEMFRNYNIVN